MIRFDTLNTKPKLTNVLIASVVTAVITAVMFLSGKANGINVSIVFMLYFITVLCFLVNAFIRQLRYNPYSYNTIYYTGFSLIIIFILIINAVLTFRAVRAPEIYNSFDIIYLLEGTATAYMVGSFPFVFVFSVALCISNISLIRHEGKRFVNILGIILSFLLIGGILILMLVDFRAAETEVQLIIQEMIRNMYAVIYLYFECMLIGAIIASLIVIRYEPDRDKDYMIILGCGLRKDGTPTPLLRGRIERALEFYHRQIAETGKELTFVASGGQGGDEVIAEGESIRKYLVSRGIPDAMIIVEDRSTDTFENMKFSKAVIEDDEAITPETKIAFSTTNYHVFRSGLYARRVKMRAEGIGAKTKWYFWPNAWVREFVGILTEHRAKQALIFCGMVAIYAVLTILCFV